MIRATDHTAVTAARAVNAAVQRPRKRIEKLLNIQSLDPGPEPSEDKLLLIRFAVPIRIFEIPEVRCAPDEQTAIEPAQRGRPRQVVREKGRLVELPVTVRIF